MYTHTLTLLSIYASTTSPLYKVFRKSSFAPILCLHMTCKTDFLAKRMKGPAFKRETLPQINITFLYLGLTLLTSIIIEDQTRQGRIGGVS